MKNKEKETDLPKEEATAEETTEPISEQEPENETKTDEWQDRYIRLAADFDNYKKRSKAEKDGIYTAATADAVEQLLPVLDNLERALGAAQEDSPLRTGVEMVLSQTEKIFEKMGVSPVGAPGDSFDPNIHNAVMHVEDEAFGENEIAEVLQKGYLLGDKVIRHALVKVAN